MVTLTIIGILCLVVLLTCLAETDNGGWGVLAILCVLAICEFWLAKGALAVVWNYIATYPGVVIAGFVMYLMLGIGWSILKWKMWINDFIKKNKGNVEMMRKNFAAGKSFNTPIDIDPSWNNSRIISWMGYWPFSFGWFIIHKPFTRLYNWLFEELTKVYQQISNSVYKEPTT